MNAGQRVRRQCDSEDRFVVPTDPLSQVTDQVRLSGLSTGIVRVRPPFAKTVARDGLHVFLMTHGQVYVEMIDDVDSPPILLKTGDVLVIPRPIAYRLLYPLNVPRTLDVTMRRLNKSSPPRPEEIEILGAICYLDRAHRNLLTDFLPSVMHLRKGTPGLKRWMYHTVELFRTEHQARSMGHCSILSRLSEIVCVQVLRIWMEQLPPDAKGLLKGLTDDRIGRALQAIHSEPARRWTVASLAHYCGMSRTGFAVRFKTLVGESPMVYVARWRMHHAVGLFEKGTGSLKRVVAAAGYKSRSSFRLNFKRQFGVLPREYQKMRQAAQMEHL